MILTVTGLVPGPPAGRLPASPAYHQCNRGQVITRARDYIKDKLEKVEDLFKTAVEDMQQDLDER